MEEDDKVDCKNKVEQSISQWQYGKIATNPDPMCTLNSEGWGAAWKIGEYLDEYLPSKYEVSEPIGQVFVDSAELDCESHYSRNPFYTSVAYLSQNKENGPNLNLICRKTNSQLVNDLQPDEAVGTKLVFTTKQRIYNTENLIPPNCPSQDSLLSLMLAKDDSKPCTYLYANKATVVVLTDWNKAIGKYNMGKVYHDFDNVL
eukprot:CAMPEP_0203765458 /NCGR_PEP_ID=MMETSP0098-20131031/18426_1 /ASSEMBLY_ACC=CAM_ASM_000208 /TAXON_ID=96639 /ORGANISM=" , Strain NY0313808BC1" /LENGTH=201 /DNA_ID=CAMNT_0050661715 /DNA_START=475 /DNA_END=1080 /DNA_ORIENTATION=-